MSGTLNDYESWKGKCPTCGSSAPRPCARCAELEAEAAALAEVSALQSSAVMGLLTAAMPYEVAGRNAKPCVPVEEAIRMRRALWHLAEALEQTIAAGRFDVEEPDIQARIAQAEARAAAEIEVVYRSTPAQPAEGSKG